MCIVEDDMALRIDDKQWISTEIAKATLALRPRGWKKAAFIIRELGPIVASVGVIVALLGITIGALYQSFSHVAVEATFRSNTENRLTGIEKQMVSLRALISANQPLKKGNQDAAKELLSEARQKAIPTITNLSRGAIRT